MFGKNAVKLVGHLFNIGSSTFLCAILQTKCIDFAIGTFLRDNLIYLQLYKVCINIFCFVYMLKNIKL